MGLYTYAQFKDRLKLRLGNNDAWDDYYGVWINSAYRELCTKQTVWELKRTLYIPQLETSTTAATVDGTGYVSVPSDCLAIREVYDSTNELRLTWMSWPYYISKTNKSVEADRDEPLLWHRKGGYIFLYPTPEDAYTLTIYYKKLVDDLTDNAEVTDIGAEWDDIILEMAHFHARMWNNEYDKAKISKEYAKEKVAELMMVYGTEEKARTEMLRPDPNMIGQETY
jgi:hypothetical protein